MNEPIKETTKKEYLSTSQALLELGGEYFIKGLVVLTGCLIALGAAAAFFYQHIHSGKEITIEQVVIAVGFGYGAMNRFFFGEVKAKRPPSKR
jgi:hypothetical protein